MKYNLSQRGNPSNPFSPKQWYASPVGSGSVTKKELSKEIAEQSRVSFALASYLVENLTEAVAAHLLEGESVRLDGLGSMRVSFGSDGVDDPKDFKVEMINAVKIVFTPSASFKKSLLAKLSKGGDPHF